MRHWFDKEKIVVAYVQPRRRRRRERRTEWSTTSSRSEFVCGSSPFSSCSSFESANKEVFEKSKKRCLDELEQGSPDPNAGSEGEGASRYERMQELVAVEQKEYGTGKAPRSSPAAATWPRCACCTTAT